MHLFFNASKELHDSLFKLKELITLSIKRPTVHI